MNRNTYRLVFNKTLGLLVPAAETARRHGKAASGAALVLATTVLNPIAHAELPVPCGGGTCGAIPGFVSHGNAAYQVNGNQAYINQVGDKSILNWKSFNVSPGHGVQFGQVDNLVSQNYVPGASFTSLNRIWDNNPTVIAGLISQAAGQKANVILVNTNGIAFMGGAQVNLNTFTASSLDINNRFITDKFLPGDSKPQFEGSGGFIKVFENASITAGSQGRVMLIAPTVINKGAVEAPDGQVILAAGSKVYLAAVGSSEKRLSGLSVEIDTPADLNDFDMNNPAVKNGMLDGQAVSLINATEDKLGHATNAGVLSTPRGNITMVGYAVNQNGIARATTSVVQNGSVYLLGKDRGLTLGSTASTRGGRVTLGKNSLTEVLPEINDRSGALDADNKDQTSAVDDGSGLVRKSWIRLLGQDVSIAGGAMVHAPSATVEMIALENPSTFEQNDDPLKLANKGLNSSTARVHIAAGASIDVSGLKDVSVDGKRNFVEVQLRGDELKDSPVNRVGPLRGQKAYVDIGRALNNAKSGKTMLISTDSLQSYQDKIERSVAERSTVGGVVNVLSQGYAILEEGVNINLSGGSVKYEAADVKSTLLHSGGSLIDIADATADRRYDGIANQFVKDYGRWNIKETFEGIGGTQHQAEYVEGKNAGSAQVVGMSGIFMRAGIQGTTAQGPMQTKAGIAPAGAKLTLGKGDVANDYKLNQRVAVVNRGAMGPSQFDFSKDFPEALKQTLEVDAALLDKDRVAQLEIFSNQTAEVRDVLRAPARGKVRIDADSIDVKADVIVPAGSIVLNARKNVINDTTLSNDVRVADGVTLATRGAWVNELPGIGGGADSPAGVDGGKITVSARNDVVLGKGTLLDATAGGRVAANKKIIGGKGGELIIGGIYTPEERDPDGKLVTPEQFTSEGKLTLSGEFKAHGFGQGGKLTIISPAITIGGSADAQTLSLDSGFFERGGFSSYKVGAINSLVVNDGVVIAPKTGRLFLQPDYFSRPSGGAIDRFTTLALPEDRLREPLSLTFNSNIDLTVGRGALIDAGDKASIVLKASRLLEIDGQIATPGGSITVTLAGGTGQFDPSQTLWLGDTARLTTAGAARTYPDASQRMRGEVLAGGNIALNADVGYLVARPGSVVNVSGAAPVKLDITNESGGVGRMVGSDAGSITLGAREGALVAGTLTAHGGGSTNRGGSFVFSLGKAKDTDVDRAAAGYPVVARTLLLAQDSPIASGALTPGAAIPDSLNGQAVISANQLDAAGFDRVSLKSTDKIALENGLGMGANHAVPLKEIKLDTPNIETMGGDAALTAHTLRLGNFDQDIGRQSAAATPAAGKGTFTANAQLIEIGGNVAFNGMERANFNGAQEIRFSGVNAGTDKQPLGSLKAAADLIFHGALIAPSTYSIFKIDAPDHRVEFARNTDAAVQPLSAFGELSVNAKNIVQAGNLWAPFGKFEFEAKEKLFFSNGSLTSVAAGKDSVVPFGKVENGRKWVYGDGSNEINLDAMPKSIHTEAADIDMQAGANISVAGGGDLQAYEFTVGPGGSRDVLDDKRVFAVLPGFGSGFAPTDPQEGRGFARNYGDSVYLSGMPGLAAGVYTLLPSHYALLPGAYAVKLSGATDLLPAQNYAKQDGSSIVAGYFTDSRSNAPRDARWSGFEVLSRDQVLARSELALVRASEHFAESRNRPIDAGLLSISTTGSVKLDANYMTSGLNGGRGAAVDISAPKLMIGDNNSDVIDPAATLLEVDKLNALGAESLFIGGTRVQTLASPTLTESEGPTTTLNVAAQEVTLANDAADALKGPEIILAATDTLTLKSGSAIEAEGPAGDAGEYLTQGEGALIRAASTKASYKRDFTGTPSKGTLVGEAGSKISASKSIILDATKDNQFKGAFEFAEKGVPTAGDLDLGATRISFGDKAKDQQAKGLVEGLVFDQAQLDKFNALGSLALTSYSTFDLYGGVNVGGIDAQGKPALQSMTLKGAGLAGLQNRGETANLRAVEIVLANPAAQVFANPSNAPLGNGTLAMQADKLVLGEGDKGIQGYAKVNINVNELVGRDKGKAGPATTTIEGDVDINVARISGERGADQALAVENGKLNIAKLTADRALAAVNALGAKWALSGAGLKFDTLASLPSGQLSLKATAGNLELGANAEVDAAGRSVQFFDVSRPAPGGNVELISEKGDVIISSGAKVDVSAASGGNAGELLVSAVEGKTDIAASSLNGRAPLDADGKRGKGARFELDAGALTDFSTLNSELNQGGFDGGRKLRVRSGDVSVAATDVVKAQDVYIAADQGKLSVAGNSHIDASGEQAGSITLYGKSVDVHAGAMLDAFATGAGQDGGKIQIGIDVLGDGSLNLDRDALINVSGNGGEGGKVLLRAPRTGGGAGNDVAVAAVSNNIKGAKSVVIEAVKVYDKVGNADITQFGTGTSSGGKLGMDSVRNDNTAFMKNLAAIETRFGRVADAAFHVRPGVEVRAAGNLATASDLSLHTWRYDSKTGALVTSVADLKSGANGNGLLEPGLLTLRASGKLEIKNNLSDGFSHATPCITATCSATSTPATLHGGESWGYRLVAGADTSAIDPLAVEFDKDKDITLAAGKLVRTGTGNIEIAAGGDINLADNKSVIYTAGRAADSVSGFITPTNAQFSQGGGDVRLIALGDIVGKPSQQLYSNWLFRQGQLDASGSKYTTQPAWWVRFDQFQQGIGALGGGNVAIRAGGKIENLSASTPSQARMASAAPDANKLLLTGGGNLSIDVGSDLLGGQYYADRGRMDISVGGKIDSGGKVYTILALGDSEASVQADNDVNIHAIINPHLVQQTFGKGMNVENLPDPNRTTNPTQWSIFSTYGPSAGAALGSLDGKVVLHNAIVAKSGVMSSLTSTYSSVFKPAAQNPYRADELLTLPPNLLFSSFQQNVDVMNAGTLTPAAHGNLTMLAADSVSVLRPLSMSAADPALIPGVVNPMHVFKADSTKPFEQVAISPIHAGDTQPVRVYAVKGDVKGSVNSIALAASKAVFVRAGRDMSDFSVTGQHANRSDVSLIEAARDIVFDTQTNRSNNAKIWVGGAGRLEVIAGRDIDLGTSEGIVARGDLDNPTLPTTGLDIHVAAGVGAKGVNYAGVVDRLLAKLETGIPDDTTLWQARWLTGNESLAAADARTAVQTVDALTADAQRERVRSMVFTALRTTGRDSNDREGDYAGDYARGYAALELVFPGISEKNANGKFRNYLGGVNLFASRIRTERGGNIEFMIPGGGLTVGLANTKDELVNADALKETGVLGIVTVEAGNINGFARDNILVNQSRVLTVAGGDIMLWSSEGNIDAGKGKKTSVSVPPPIRKLNPQTGAFSLEFQGAVTGAGIGALKTGTLEAGDVDLIAPRGSVDAGDAGIRARNLNIAAQVVIGADNISVSGTSTGTPVADMSAVTATTSGATSAGGDVSKTTEELTKNLSEAARAAEALKKAFKPTFISAEVIGHGE